MTEKFAVKLTLEQIGNIKTSKCKKMRRKVTEQIFQEKKEK